MTPPKKTPRKEVRRVKRDRFYGLMIFRKGWHTPWTREIFPSEEYAKHYFDSYCTQHNFDFDWSDYVLVRCTVTYTLPAPKRKKDSK